MIPLALALLLVPVALVMVLMAPSDRPTTNPFPAPSWAGTPAARSTASPSQTTADITAFGAYPPSEAAVVAVITTGQAQATSKNSPNQRRSALTQRNQAMCALLPAIGPAAVKDWTGRLEETGTTLTGERWVTVLIADSVRLRTNTGIEDTSDRTMVPAGTELSERVGSLRPGQLVRFSGSFLWDWNDCVENQKLTYNAALGEPDFTFKFAEVSPAP